MSDDLAREIESLKKENKQRRAMLEARFDYIRVLEGVAKWTRHLMADMKDNEPTEYNSFFALKDAIAALELWEKGRIKSYPKDMPFEDFCEVMKDE